MESVRCDTDGSFQKNRHLPSPTTPSSFPPTFFLPHAFGPLGRAIKLVAPHTTNSLYHALNYLELAKRGLRAMILTLCISFTDLLYSPSSSSSQAMTDSPGWTFSHSTDLTKSLSRPPPFLNSAEDPTSYIYISPFTRLHEPPCHARTLPPPSSSLRPGPSFFPPGPGRHHTLRSAFQSVHPVSPEGPEVTSSVLDAVAKMIWREIESRKGHWIPYTFQSPKCAV